MSEVLVIDGRMLEPPEPFLRVMAALDHLDRGEFDSVSLLLYREPFPLYKTLAGNGYGWTVEHEADGTFVIRIRLARS